MSLDHYPVGRHEAGGPARGSMEVQSLIGTASEQPVIPVHRPLSTFERVISTHAPILESLLLQSPTDTIFRLYHTSHYLRTFLRSYPTAWKYLSFRLLYPSGTQTRPLIAGSPDPDTLRQSRPYALDQLLMTVVIPFSPCLKSLELDNTAVSGQILISTVLHSRRETLEHLSVRGCKNVSLKYHIIPYLTMFGLQCDVDMEKNVGRSPATKQLALKSLYTYRCRHHRRRPYLSSSLLRKDSDSEPTHELVNLCHKLGIWTDTAWCTTPAGRCFRRRGYVSMRVPQGAPEVWVVFDRLWRSKNWIGPVTDNPDHVTKRDGKLWEHDETGCYGEPLGTGEGREFGEGKTVPAHLRRSHRRFVENIKCDACFEDISERCEQCSVLMHCVGCRKTLCASCAYDRPYPRIKPKPVNGVAPETFWWAPGATTSPCVMQEPPLDPALPNPTNPMPPPHYPTLKFHWCCTEPIFSGGGGISIGTASRDADAVRAAPLPRGQGWEDPEYSTDEWSKTFPRYAYGDPRQPDYSLEAGHVEMMRWLLGPPGRPVSSCPRNLCQECYESPQWKVHCKSCSKPLCMEHDLRGLRLRICGYRDLALEKMALQSRSAAGSGALGNHLGGSSMFRSGSAPGFASRPGPRDNSSIINRHDSAASSIAGDHIADGLVDTHPADPQQFIHPALRDRRLTHSDSPTNSNHSRSSSPVSLLFDTSPEIPKWQGCQSFFCPQYRAVGDQRQRCTGVLRECTSCSVNVCQDCVNSNPPCNCSSCEANYLCPNCLKLRERDGTCRRAAEARASKEERWKRDMEALEDILERKLANEVAEFAGQFFDWIVRNRNLDHASNQFEHHNDHNDDRFPDNPDVDVAAGENSSSSPE
ncbi:hypothetical protein VTN02DRAFT_2157 [Thermoascus thermophilus]